MEGVTDCGPLGVWTVIVFCAESVTYFIPSGVDTALEPADTTLAESCPADSFDGTTLELVSAVFGFGLDDLGLPAPK